MPLDPDEEETLQEPYVPIEETKEADEIGENEDEDIKGEELEKEEDPDS